MPRFHLLGDTRQSAEASGLFRWFMLEPVAADVAAPDQRAAHYRPNGPAFHLQTELVLTTNDSDRLLGLELRLARGFIEHDHNGLFARDIAKSVLRDSIEGTDAERLGDVINQIEFPATVRAPFITTRTPDSPVPSGPTPGYEVYLGLRGRWEYRGVGFTLVLENYDCDGDPWFRFSSMAR